MCLYKAKGPADGPVALTDSDLDTIRRIMEESIEDRSPKSSLGQECLVEREGRHSSIVLICENPILAKVAIETLNIMVQRLQQHFGERYNVTAPSVLKQAAA